MKASLIVPAAGAGKRLSSKVPKSFLSLDGKPLIVHTLERLAKTFKFREVIVAASPENVLRMWELLRRHKIKHASVVSGGKTRAESVGNALNWVSRESDYVFVHDAARPFVTAKILQDLKNAVIKSGAAICAIPVTSTVKRAKSGTILKTEDRRTLFLAQTPQAFRREWLSRRYQTLGKKAFFVTDEAQLFDGTAVRVSLVAGDARNIKITTPEDLALFSFYKKALRK